MSIFLFIELERDIPNFRDRFDGKPLAHVQCEIDAIAERLGVVRLDEMMSLSPEKAAELLSDRPDWDGHFETSWYDPAEGLRTFETLMDYFAKHPEELAAFEYPEYVREDLEEAARTLQAAREAGVRFYIDCAC
jgi:hypothetical protein